MDVTRIHEYTDIYVEAFMSALNKTHNADLAVQVAMGVTIGSVARLAHDCQRIAAAHFLTCRHQQF